MSSQPWTTEKLQRLFAPGRGLKVLCQGRRASAHPAVHHALVLAVEGDEMILSPPGPSLLPPLLGQSLEITVLDSQARGPGRRFAYVSSILDELPAFATPQGPRPAVVVMFPRSQDMYATSLRKVRRFAVPPEAPVQLWLEQERLNLLDISQKGLRFSNGETLRAYQLGDEMKLRLVIHDEPQKVRGRVAANNAHAQGREVSLELGILSLDAWTSLLEILKELENTQLRQGNKR